jgi:hypothetical protein
VTEREREWGERVCAAENKQAHSTHHRSRTCPAHANRAQQRMGRTTLHNESKETTNTPQGGRTQYVRRARRPISVAAALVKSILPHSNSCTKLLIFSAATLMPRSAANASQKRTRNTSVREAHEEKFTYAAVGFEGEHTGFSQLAASHTHTHTHTHTFGRRVGDSGATRRESHVVAQRGDPLTLGLSLSLSVGCRACW